MSETPRPRIAVLDPDGGRLDVPVEVMVAEPRARMGTVALGLAGLAVLLGGFGVLSGLNFIADQFARGAVQGWAAVAVAGVGVGLLGTGVVREGRALFRLAAVDGVRARLGNPATARQAALDWLATLPEPVPASVRTLNDPDAVLAFLRDGPVATLRRRAEGLGTNAAVGVFALTAAVPSPALDAAVVAWRGVRLIRQVAALHGMRPGLLGTVALLRRTAAAASMTAIANVATDTALRALLSNPTLAALAGDAAGATIAARRMIVLARAAAAACSPLPPEG